eukprot:Sspe_Gene.1702::Locus_568_Transcript_3_4_Confidence_0.167_Length_2842::g.1702::m.1702
MHPLRFTHCFLSFRYSHSSCELHLAASSLYRRPALHRDARRPRPLARRLLLALRLLPGQGRAPLLLRARLVPLARHVCVALRQRPVPNRSSSPRTCPESSTRTRRHSCTSSPPCASRNPVLSVHSPVAVFPTHAPCRSCTSRTSGAPRTASCPRTSRPSNGTGCPPRTGPSASSRGIPPPGLHVGTAAMVSHQHISSPLHETSEGCASAHLPLAHPSRPLARVRRVRHARRLVAVRSAGASLAHGPCRLPLAVRVDLALCPRLPLVARKVGVLPVLDDEGTRKGLPSLQMFSRAPSSSSTFMLTASLVATVSSVFSTFLSCSVKPRTSAAQRRRSRCAAAFSTDSGCDRRSASFTTPSVITSTACFRCRGVADHDRRHLECLCKLRPVPSKLLLLVPLEVCHQLVPRPRQPPACPRCLH